MRVLSLFSGGGLGDFGLTLAGMEIVGQVEIDEYCQKILKLRWPEVPKWRDIRDVKGAEVIKTCGAVDLISGGFPCQDISTAKPEGEGIDGEKSGLWKEMFRIICEIMPRFVLVENSSALLFRGLGNVLSDLAKIGYDAEWDCIPASALGLPHQRDRIWIIAYPDGIGLNENQNLLQGKFNRQSCWGGAYDRIDLSFGETKIQSLVVPEYLRNHDGGSNLMERIHLLGNGQVVQVVEWIGKRIMEFENSLNSRRGKNG